MNEKIKNILNPRDFRRKLLQYIFLSMIVVFVILMASFYFYSSMFLEKKADLIMLNTAKMLDNQVRQNIEKIKGNLDVLFKKDLVNDYLNFYNYKFRAKAENSRKNLEKYFLKIAEKNRKYESLVLLRVNGMSMVNILDGKISSRGDFSGKRWFQNTLLLKKNSAYISPVRLCEKHGKPEILVSKLFYDESNKKQAIICIQVHVEEFCSELVRKKIRNNGYCYFIDRTGIVLAHKEHSMVGVNLGDLRPSKNDFPESKTLLEEKNGKDKILVKKIYIPSSINGLDLVLVQNMSEVSALGRELRQFYIIFVLISILTVLIIIYIAATQFSKPVRKLHYATEEMLKGNLDVRIDIPQAQCWKINNCGREDCPSRSKTGIPCWHISGSMGNGENLGDYARKIGDCRKCRVYREHSGDELQRLAEKFNAMTFYLKEARSSLEERIKTATEDMKKTNTELREKTALLEEVNKELDSFVYTASHDLKEPLRSIETFSQFIIEDYRDRLDDTGRDYLDRIVTAASRMRNLVDDLLSLAAMSRKKSPFSLVDSGRIVKDTLQRLRYMIEEKKTKITVKENLPVIYCDEIKIGEVFYNLICNAIKYNNKEQPEIEIGTKKIYQWVPGMINSTVFFIRDNGIGINEENYDLIFQVFRRLHARDEYGGGTGAGLAIVKRIIDDHRGRVWVESELGQGSSFFFSIPAGPR